jgi:hypothetical protein
MKKLIKNTLYSIALFVAAAGCEDPDKSPFLQWEPNVFGFMQFVTPGTGALVPPDNDFYDQADVNAAAFYNEGNAASQVDLKLQWLNVDKLLSVSSIELYLYWTEYYTDIDRNVLNVTHGIDEAPKPTYPAGREVDFVTVTPGPASRDKSDFSITYAQLSAFFAGDTYDYGDGNGAVSVFSDDTATGPGGETGFRGGRVRSTAGNNFQDADVAKIDHDADDDAADLKSVNLPADQFTVSFRFITSDGKAFGTWYDSVCGETPGANCRGSWIVK